MSKEVIQLSHFIWSSVCLVRPIHASKLLLRSLGEWSHPANSV